MRFDSLGMFAPLTMPALYAICGIGALQQKRLGQSEFCQDIILNIHKRFADYFALGFWVYRRNERSNLLTINNSRSFFKFLCGINFLNGNTSFSQGINDKLVFVTHKAVVYIEGAELLGVSNRSGQSSGDRRIYASAHKGDSVAITDLFCDSPSFVLDHTRKPCFLK